MYRYKSLILVVLFFSAISLAEGKSFFWGPRFAMGTVGTWNNKRAALFDENGISHSFVKRYKGSDGVEMDFGVVTLYRLNAFIELLGEVNLGIQMLEQMDNGVYHDTVYYDIMGYARRNSLVESVSWLQASVPLLFRFKTANPFYVDVGAMLNVVFFSDHTLGEYDETDLGEFNTSITRGSVICGFGVELPMSDSFLMDVGMRFVYDFTQFENGKDSWIENESLYLESSPARLWNWQMYFAFYL